MPFGMMTEEDPRETAASRRRSGASLERVGLIGQDGEANKFVKKNVLFENNARKAALFLALAVGQGGDEIDHAAAHLGVLDRGKGARERDTFGG